MTPMIDVVFLLIIFFLVSSHLARQEAKIPLDLPLAASHLPIDFEAASLTINILPTGNWSVGGTEVTDTRLKELLADQRSRHGANALIRIRTDRQVPYSRLEPILRYAAVSGLANVSIAVTEPKKRPEVY